MAKDYMKVKRGMVFSYNIDPKVDKFNPPKIKLEDGKEITNHLQYGYRDYLVISNDLNNAHSPTCNILPITTSTTKNDIPTHVNFTYLGKDMTILCEQQYTIHVQELSRYRYTLSDEVLRNVEDALAVQLGMKRSRYDLNINTSLAQIESIIQGIIKEKVEEAESVRKADAVDIDDAVLRLGEGLLDLLSDKKKEVTVKDLPITTDLKVDGNRVSTPISISHKVGTSDINATKIYSNTTKEDSSEDVVVSTHLSSNDVNKNKTIHQSQIDKFYKRYPNLKEDSKSSPQSESTSTTEQKETKKTGRSRFRWTTDSMQMFMDDATRFSPMDMVKKYNFKDTNDYYKTRYYVQNKLAGRL